MKYFEIKSLKVVLAIFLSILCCYFALRGVDLQKIYIFVSEANILYLIAAFITVVLAQIMRSIRWGVIINPIQPVGQKIIFPICSIGFMLIMLLPARIGELARPYLLHQNSQVNMSTAVATIVLERILDSIILLIFFGIIVSNLELPSWLTRGVIIFIVGIITIIAFLFVGTIEKVKYSFNRLIDKILPQRLAGLAANMSEKFYEGLIVLGSGRRALFIMSLTLIIWSILVFCNFLLFKAFEINLGSFAAVTVLTLTALGISVPAGPGFIGTFHFACMLGLSMFGIGKDRAFTYALVNHALILFTFILLGIICVNLPGITVGLRSQKSSIAFGHIEKKMK